MIINLKMNINKEMSLALVKELFNGTLFMLHNEQFKEEVVEVKILDVAETLYSGKWLGIQLMDEEFTVGEAIKVATDLINWIHNRPL